VFVLLALGLVPWAFADTRQVCRDWLYAIRDQDALVVSAESTAPTRPLLLRHEAEHVAQERARTGVAEVTLGVARGLPVRDFYGAMPHERDADAAATVYGARLGMSPSDEDLVSPDRMLFAAPWPEPDRETVPVRLLAFSLFYPNEFDTALRGTQVGPRVDPEDALTTLLPNGAEIRQVLRSRFTDVLPRLCNHGMSESQFKELSQAEQNAFNDRLREQLVEEEHRVVADVTRLLENRVSG
jgi:hypothetical protein